jgi:hypothetical protein
MLLKTTRELEIHVKSLYEKLKPLTEREQIFKPIEVYFAEKTPIGEPGDFCYSDGECYYYGSIGDRGAVTIEKTKSLFEVTYWILKFQTSVMAFDYEKKHRVEGKDHRRIAFPFKIDLMGIIGADYRQKAEDEINEILKDYPYEDDLY